MCFAGSKWRRFAPRSHAGLQIDQMVAVVQLNPLIIHPKTLKTGQDKTHCPTAVNISFWFFFKQCTGFRSNTYTFTGPKDQLILHN